MTIYLAATTTAPTARQEIRSDAARSLLAVACPDGLLLFDRRTRSQCVLSWRVMQDLYQSLQEPPTHPD